MTASKTWSTNSLCDEEKYTQQQINLTVNNFAMQSNDIECEMCSIDLFLHVLGNGQKQKRNAKKMCCCWSFDFWPPVKWRARRCRKNFFRPLHMSVQWCKIKIAIFQDFPSFFFSFLLISFQFCNKMYVRFYFILTRTRIISM